MLNFSKMNLVSETVFLLLTFASTSVCSVPEIIELDPISSVQNNSSLQLIDDPSLLIIPLKSGADTPEPLLVPEEVSESPP